MSQQLDDDGVPEKYFSSEDDLEMKEATLAGMSEKAAIAEKDAEEEELERLVLGGRDDFRKLLFEQDVFADLDGLTKGKELQRTEEDTGLEDVPDSNLWVIDLGAGSAAPQAALSKPAQQKEGGFSGNQAAWEDSDDERLTIPLTTDVRLRRLRIANGEDTISGTEYSRRLRQRFLTLNPLPKWAQEAQAPPTKHRRRSSTASDASSSSNEDEDDLSALPLDEFLRDVGQLSGNGSTNSRRLKPEVLSIQRSRDIPDRHREAVSSISFHPKFPILLTSSTSSMLYLHHLDAAAHPTPNPKLTSVQARQVDIQRSEFCYPEGDRIFFAGRKKFFHSWDLETGHVQRTNYVLGHRLEHRSMEHFKLSPCGRFMAIIASTRKGGGNINILSTTTHQWVAAARLDSRNGIADFAWWRSGDGMTILGKSGQVGEWSMARGRFLALWRDEGCIGGIVVALGGHHGPQALGGDRWVAVGSNSGIVNVYERSAMIESSEGGVTMKERPAPTRTFEQLVTPITALTFSPDGQLLAFGSRPKADAFRLVHLPSCTVYRNWPTQQTPLGRITAVAFGPRSDILAVGNDAGKVRLWEILR